MNHLMINLIIYASNTAISVFQQDLIQMKNDESYENDTLKENLRSQKFVFKFTLFIISILAKVQFSFSLPPKFNSVLQFSTKGKGVG